MLEQPDAPWVKILEYKYFNNPNPLLDIMPKQGSWIWVGICQGLEIVKKTLRFRSW